MGASKEKDNKQLLTEIDHLKSEILRLKQKSPEGKKEQSDFIEEKNKAQQYLDIAEVMLVSIDTDGIVQMINPKGCEILGYSVDEIIGRNWFDLAIPVSQREMVKEVAKKVISGDMESVKYFENNILTKSGEERFMAFHNSDIRDKNGKIILTLSSGEDITERKLAEELVLLNEARLESLLRINDYQAGSIKDLLDFALNEAIVLTGSKIGYIYFYDESKQEFTLNTWSKEVMNECQVMKPQTIYYLEKTGLWGEAVRQRKAIMVNDLQKANPLKKGTPEGHVALHKFLTIPVFSEDQIVAVVGVANKATNYNESDIRQLNLMMNAVWKILQRKASEKALFESEEKFRSLFERSPLGLSMTGIDGSLRVNRAFCDMLGYSDAELKSKNWKEITHPEDIGKSEEIVKSLLDEKIEATKFEKRYIHKNGGLVWTEVITSLRKNIEGKPDFFITTINDISGRKRSELEIKRYNRIFEDSLNEIYLFNAESLLITQVNDAAQKNLGYSMEEFKKMTPLSFKPEFTPESFAKLVEPLRNGEKENIVFETVHQRKDQSLYQVEVHLQLFIFEGQPTYVAIILDITDRKRAENELAKLQLLYDETEKAAKIGGWTFDIETMEQTWTDEIFRILEIDLSMGAPKVPEGIAFIDPPYRQMAELAIQKSIENGEPYDQEWIVTTSKGNKRWVQAIANPIIENGKTIKISGSFQDITDRKQVEEALYKSEQKFKMLVTNIEEIIYLVDKNGIFTVSEGKGLEKLGLKPGQVVGMSVFDFYKDYPDILVGIGKALNGETSSAEVQIGPNYFTNWSTPHFNPEGEVIGLIGLAINITDRKKAENELKKHHEHLEELVKERTKDLETKNKELDNAMRVFVGRELAIRNLQDRIRALEGK